MPLFYPDLNLGSNFSAIYQELKRYDKKRTSTVGIQISKRLRNTRRGGEKTNYATVGDT